MSGPDQRSWKIHIRKDNLKFSAAHMTVFPDGSKERLHGHNYEVELEVELTEPVLSQMLSYKAFKQVLRSVCNAWDEKVLVAGDNPWLEPLSGSNDEYAFRLCANVTCCPLTKWRCWMWTTSPSKILARILFERFWMQLTGINPFPGENKSSPQVCGSMNHADRAQRIRWGTGHSNARISMKIVTVFVQASSAPAQPLPTVVAP